MAANGTKIDFATVDHDDCWPVIRAEFAVAVRTGVPHALDVRRGLELQRLLDRVLSGVAAG